MDDLPVSVLSIVTSWNKHYGSEETSEIEDLHRITIVLKCM